MAVMPDPRILIFAGSLRKGSLNKKLARVAFEALKSAGGDATLIDLADFPVPVYDGDLEAEKGLPENARKLKALMIGHPGLLIVTPEYNSSIPGALKNVLDWASRQEGEEPVLAAYKGKTAALLSASPGALGGLRSLVVLRAMLENIGTLVIPQQLAVSRAHEAFSGDGSLKDAKQKAAVDGVALALVALLKKLQ